MSQKSRKNEADTWIESDPGGVMVSGGESGTDTAQEEIPRREDIG